MDMKASLANLSVLLALIAAVALGARCDDSRERAILPHNGAGLQLLSHGKAFLSATGDSGEEYWIYGSETSVDAMLMDVTVRLHEANWRTYSLPPSGLGAANGDRCVSYDDFSSDSSFVTAVKDWAVEREPVLQRRASEFDAVLLVEEFPCP